MLLAVMLKLSGDTQWCSALAVTGKSSIKSLDGMEKVHCNIAHISQSVLYDASPNCEVESEHASVTHKNTVLPVSAQASSSNDVDSQPQQQQQLVQSSWQPAVEVTCDRQQPQQD